MWYRREVTYEVSLHLNKAIPEIVIAGVTTGNAQANIDFDICSANGKGYTVYISGSWDGEYTDANTNFNSKGAHIKGLENGKAYYDYVEYSRGGILERSAIVEFAPGK